MRHLTPRDFTVQPWKNGRGQTIEMLRIETEDGLLLRLSRASVVEDGPFSLFPGVERNLTVLTGPGFRLTGPGLDLRCAPLVPVAFPGDVAVVATETAGQASDDFNVMTARHLPRPEVSACSAPARFAADLLALYALGPAVVDGTPIAAGDLVLAEGELSLQDGGPVLAVRASGVSLPLVRS